MTDAEVTVKKAKIVDILEGIDTTEIDRKYRMYCFVLKQLSPMQKGIQAAHSIVEYGNKHHNDESYIVWSRADKTIILLDGGVSHELEDIIDELEANEVEYAVFREEDLGELVTSISILVDERVFDRVNYPDFGEWRNRKYPIREMHLMACIGDFDHDPNDFTYEKHREEWINDVMGGNKNVYLRELISGKHLAK